MTRAAHALRAVAAALVLAVAVGQPTPTPAVDAAPDAAALLATATADGRVRVLVDLALPFVPEATLAVDAVSAQRQRIDAAQAAVLADLPAATRVLRRFARAPLLALEVDADALRRLLADPRVARVAADGLNRPSLAQSVALVAGDVAHARGLDGRGWAVAVLDTGVDTAHPFLAGQTVAEACFSSTGPGYVSACPNGETTQIGPGAAAPPEADGGPHGTHVAGIAVGAGDGQPPGVAPGADLIAVQVFSVFTAVDDCGGTAPCVLAWDSDILAGLDHVDELGATIDVAAANLSLGGGRVAGTCFTPSLVTAVTAAGIAVVVASGNEGYTDAIAWPACWDGAVSVGATGDGSNGWAADEVAWFSNANADLDLLAPGVSIRSSVPGGYQNYGGTSMAAPHVAGAWALARQDDPTASVASVLERFRRDGVPVLDARNGTTYPRLDLSTLGLVVATFTIVDADEVRDDGAGGVEYVYARTGAAIEPTFASSPPGVGFAWSAVRVEDGDGTPVDPPAAAPSIVDAGLYAVTVVADDPDHTGTSVLAVRVEGGSPADACRLDATDLRALGDADGDGTVTEADALRVLRMATGSWAPPPADDPATVRHADVDGDGLVTEDDARAVLRAALDPAAARSLVAHPGGLTLAVGEGACVLVGRLAGGALGALAVTADAGLDVADATPPGAVGRAYGVVRTGPGTGTVRFDGGAAGAVEVAVQAP